MIEEVPSRPLAYRFSHELVRRAVYDRLPSLRRAELHLLVAESLERRASPAPPVELAHHFTAASPIDGPRRAIAHSLVAGRASSLRSLDSRGGRGPFRSRARARASRSRCTAPRSASSWVPPVSAVVDSYEAIAAFEDAASIAREHDDAELLAAAAIGLEEACWRPRRRARARSNCCRRRSRGPTRWSDSSAHQAAHGHQSRARVHRPLLAESSGAESDAIAMARRLDGGALGWRRAAGADLLVADAAEPGPSTLTICWPRRATWPSSCPSPSFGRGDGVAISQGSSRSAMCGRPSWSWWRSGTPSLGCGSHSRCMSPSPTPRRWRCVAGGWPSRGGGEALARVERC